MSMFAMPEYLGGITRDIIVNPITQTVETTDTGAYVGSLGSQAGLATCFGNSDGSISVFCDEESVVMGVMYVMPMPVYDSVLPKWLTYRERLDSFNPEFDHIGYQPIYLRELSLYLHQSKPSRKTIRSASVQTLMSLLQIRIRSLPLFCCLILTVS